MLLLVVIGFICRRWWVIGLWLVGATVLGGLVALGAGREITADAVILSLMQGGVAIALGRGIAEGLAWFRRRGGASSAEARPSDDYDFHS